MKHVNAERRAFLSRSLAASLTATIGGMAISGASFADPAPLDPSDPLAKALGYVTQSAKPDAKCSNCSQYQGKSGSAQGLCTIFPGKTVAAAGWCLSWVVKKAV